MAAGVKMQHVVTSALRGQSTAGKAVAMMGRRWSSSSTTSVTVGFIGVGNMGEPMARNLAAAGHGLVLYDVNTSHAQGVAQRERTNLRNLVALDAQLPARKMWT